MGILYAIATASYALGLIVYFEHRTHIKPYHILMLVFGFSAVFGYTAGVYAERLETYLFCQLLYSLSMLMVLYYMVITIGELCQLPLTALCKNILIGTIILLFFMICDPFALYLYQYDAVLQKRNGFTYALIEKGPAYYLKVIYILTCFLLIVANSLKALTSKRQVSKRTCRYLIVVSFSVLIIYLLKWVTGSIYDFIPLYMPFVQIFMIIVIRKMSLYDINETFASVFEERTQYCYICLDGEKRYMGCSKMCLELFPRLEFQRVDEKIPETRCPEFTLIMKQIDDWIIDGKDHVIDIDGEHPLTLSCKVHTIIVSNRIIGILVEMVDITKSQREKRWLDTNNQMLEAELAVQTERIQRIQGSIITGMARMVESRDNSTGGHINRTSAVVRCFIEHIADNYTFSWCTSDFCLKLIEAAPLHDLGKIAVNDEILRKTGKFTPEEFMEMKKHAGEGAKIVSSVLGEVEDEEFKKIAENVAHYHHEKWNGEGYPCGLTGREIPIEARIMALADVFDALVSKRCYKDAFSYDTAFEIIRDSLGTQFDPDLGKIFLECREQLIDLYNNFDLK